MKKDPGPGSPLGDELRRPGNASTLVSEEFPTNKPDYCDLPTHVPDRSGITPVYRQTVAAVERLFLATGAPQEKAAEFAGLPDRYLAKMFHPDSPSGKQASWATLQRVLDVVAADGFTLTIEARPGPIFDALSHKFEMRYDRARAKPQTRRQLLAEWGRRGGLKKRELPLEERLKIARRLNRARKRKLSTEKRSKLASEASRARWLRRRKKKNPGASS
jgi:hypothetical protein